MIIKKIILLIVSSTIFISCSSLFKVKRLQDCEFAFSHVSNTVLADIPIQEKNSISDFTFSEMGQISKAFFSKNLPLDFIANISIKNPNKKKALLTKLEWILLIEQDQIALGTIDQEHEIEGFSTISVPIKVSTDVYELWRNKSRDAALKLLFNMSDDSGKPIKLTIKVKPIFTIGKKEIKSPNYFIINTELTSPE